MRLRPLSPVCNLVCLNESSRIPAEFGPYYLRLALLGTSSSMTMILNRHVCLRVFFFCYLNTSTAAAFVTIHSDILYK